MAPHSIDVTRLSRRYEAGENRAFRVPVYHFLNLGGDSVHPRDVPRRLLREHALHVDAKVDPVCVAERVHHTSQTIRCYPRFPTVVAP